ncbi:GH36-type glycosyl hydrolase domain-containing protein [Elusimicrobiota bacterium]
MKLFKNIKTRINKLLLSRKVSDEHPLRAELFNVDQLEQHAKMLAGRHEVTSKRVPEMLLPRLKNNEYILLKTRDFLESAGKAKRRISMAGEWLIDNFYLIEEQILLSQRHLPKGYSQELPHLVKGPLAGHPRVYEIASEIIAHGDGHIDEKGLLSFIKSYQTIAPLRLGELWAIPIMLRLALIENLRRVASRLTISQIDRNKADYWSNRMTEVFDKDANSLIVEIAAMAKADPPMSSTFVSEFVRRLHGLSSTLTLPLTWLEKKLAEKGQTVDQMLQLASQRQASDQVSISNSIASLRLLESADWRDFVEELSLVEQVLRKDPSGAYSGMDFATRDRYRHVIEAVATRSKLQEHVVASKVVQTAQNCMKDNGYNDRASHIGYHLIGGGFQRFAKLINIRLKFSEIMQTKGNTLSGILYFLPMLVINLFATAVIIVQGYAFGLRGPLLWIAAVLLLFATSQLAVSIVNWLVTMLIKPNDLPKMDFSKGIPPQFHTLIMIPTMLNNAKGVEELLEGLEVRYLANNDPSLHFGLLTDFIDAKQEKIPDDETLLNLAVSGVKRLNKKYAREAGEIFFLFHRPRLWNEQEKIWMGYERKRGKLSDLNMLLRGGGKEKFSKIVGDVSILQDVKYVITLDTDTQMPRDAAHQLIGTIAHPLNQAYYDEALQRVTKGYGILQPRVDVSYPGNKVSHFVRIFGGEPGIDPYTRAASDVYQDMFKEGSFIGKGLYDVDAFERSLDKRFPENLILSHDLLEGCYARSGLITDVQLYEAYPYSYIKDVSRRYRWMRGDWQIIKWLLFKVPGFDSKVYKNPISLISKWKIYDNLRRSIVSFSTSMLFILGWILFKPAWFWTLVVMGIVALPMFFMSMVPIVRKPKDLELKSHISSILGLLGKHLFQFMFIIGFVIYDAFFSLNAIISTIWRMFISKRRLLEWRTSGESSTPTSAFGFLRVMYISPSIAASILLFYYFGKLQIALAEQTLLCIWFLSPFFAWWLSKPISTKDVKLSGKQIIYLRNLSRKIWRFFETFVTADDNWLPPDNFQESPIKVVAHRTSPTNMGLALLSKLTAHDFGYISPGKLVNRLKKSLNSMGKLDRFRGHFYNWYNTQTLIPQQPLYVSTVDSGNLVGHLIVLRMGLIELIDKKIFSKTVFEGISDTLRLLYDNTNNILKSKEKNKDIQKVAEIINRIQNELKTEPESLTPFYAMLRRITLDVQEIIRVIPLKDSNELQWWAKALELQCYDYINDTAFIAPWIKISQPLSDIWTRGTDEQKEDLNRLREKLKELDYNPTLREISVLENDLLPLLDKVTSNIDASSDTEAESEKDWMINLKSIVKNASDHANERIIEIETIIKQCNEFSDIEYDFLYDKTSHLFYIGYNVNQRKTDASCYDLLASEARLCSFIAIAQGKIPQEHWFSLGRLLTKTAGDPVLISWGGSMFEYLMPLLVMPNYENTLLDRTYKAVIKTQKEYGKKRNVPWGVSESGYNIIDASMNYQYRSFGIPEIGFKRGLFEDIVIAPYASMMGLMVSPEESCENLEVMSDKGFEGIYGFYEAIDFTPSRVSSDESYSIVESFMAHHQGMSFLSLSYLLLNQPMQKRFLMDPMCKATELLLQERVPKTVPYLYDTEVTGILRSVEEKETLMRVFSNPNTAAPEVHLLTNGQYNVMVTNSGAGYSKWKNFSVSRWHEDSVQDKWGNFTYVRDVESGEFWSTAFQPTQTKSKYYEAIFSQSKAELRRKDHEIETYTEIVVSPEDDIEIRRTTVVNQSRTRRVIEFTSYAEVVIASQSEDDSHKSFSSLFIQTQIDFSKQAIICNRRPRSENEKMPWMLHLMAVHGETTEGATYETDRAKFIGRGKSLVRPFAMTDSDKLSNSEGSVLDPIVSIRCRVILEPDESATIDYITGVSETKQMASYLIDKYRDKNLADRVFDLAWTQAQIKLQQINATESDAQLYGRLASSLIYINASWRANANILKQNTRGQSDLWGYSISGDIPIVLLRIEDQANMDILRHIVQAHEYWRMKGLMVDLLIWNEDHSVYRDLLNDQIVGLVTAGIESQTLNKPGGIFIRRADQMSNEDKILMQTVARIVITDRGGSLEEQLERRGHSKLNVLPFTPTKRQEKEKVINIEPNRKDLLYFNGFGGFSKNGREYVIITSKDRATPAPWSNVLANPNFGTVVSESGGAYTWSENAHEFRITPWKNDSVTDSSGEAMYVRDEETGDYWSPTPLPARGKTPYVSRHGFGYSIFEHAQEGIETELTVYTALESPVKFGVLRIKNRSGRKRKLSATGYYELILGDLRQKTHMHIVTELDPKSGALIAYNPYNKEFHGRVAFLDVNDSTRSVSGDKKEFIGRNRTLANPEIMLRERLSGKVGAGSEACAAMQVKFDLIDNDEREIIFTLGAGKSIDEAKSIIHKFKGAVSVHKELDKVIHYWERSLGVLQVDTPDKSVNILANGWLQYQALACRIWARSGYYQSGGAFGFRDQLQDAMSLVYSDPGILKNILIDFAQHQFIEGDVQHWWHPPSGRGVRTHCSDDYLWLVFAACHYVKTSGDKGILNEIIPFIEGPLVKPDTESYFDIPKKSSETGTLYEHCVLAIERALKFGEHGLPLMGHGDWNDGMNLVGAKGKGESVWLAFFLYSVLISFSEISEMHGDKEFSKTCLNKAENLKENIEKNAWDGQWYKRAYFDNGDPLGSASNMECQIDSIPQSWSIISKAGDLQRSKQAMDSVDNRLVDRKNSLIKLFDPAFDKSDLNPGYIKGYVPGVRENGGQYTHAAVWAVMAFAILGDSEKASELLSLINPINHSTDENGINKYRVEPYVMAGDVYAVSPNEGRGGWTWYSGSAGWMYQLIIMYLLGIKISANKLYFEPCISKDWKSYKIHYKYKNTLYNITVTKNASNKKDHVVLDGHAQDESFLTLVNDNKEHTVQIKLI